MGRRRNRNDLVVPEARRELNQFKSKVLAKDGLIPEGTRPDQITYEVAKEIGVPYSQNYNGDLSTKNAGKIGGNIGGRMVKELVRLAEEELTKKNKLT